MDLANLEVHIAPKVLAEPFPGLQITDTVVTLWLVMAILIGLGLVVRFTIKEVPGTFQNLVEWVLGGLHNFMEQVGGKAAKQHFPLFITLFLIILFSNWLGLSMGTVGETLGFLRAPTSDLNTTAAFALIAFLYFEYQGIRAHGALGYFGHFVNVKALFTKGGMGVVDFFQGILHIISELVRPVALSLRLFGNIFGGEIVLTIAFLLVSALVPVPFMLLEFIVGLIQAFVFATLFLTFTMMNTAHEEESHA